MQRVWPLSPSLGPQRHESSILRQPWGVPVRVCQAEGHPHQSLGTLHQSWAWSQASHSDLVHVSLMPHPLCLHNSPYPS